MTSELSGVPEHEVLRIERTADPKRKAIFAFARKVSREPASITRADVDALRPYLTDAQIVELVFAVCRYNTMNRLADAFGVPLETENPFAPRPEPGPVPGASEGAPGVVNGVRGNTVGISVGSDDKVRLGDTYSLSRGSKYVGRILITSVDKNQSVGEFDDKIYGSGAPPQVGDKATPSGGELTVESPPRRSSWHLPANEGAPGVVDGVRGNLVGISVGSDDKVRLGDIYSLSRGAQYVGRIIITNVDKNRSVGEFDDRFPGSGAPPQVGDKATPGGLE